MTVTVKSRNSTNAGFKARLAVWKDPQNQNKSKNPKIQKIMATIVRIVTTVTTFCTPPMSCLNRYSLHLASLSGLVLVPLRTTPIGKDPRPLSILPLSLSTSKPSFALVRATLTQNGCLLQAFRLDFCRSTWGSKQGLMVHVQFRASRPMSP